MLDFGVRFGALVRQKRGVEGLTQEALAFKAFGPTGRKAQISDLERGKIANPQAKIVDPLVVALAISDAELRACREPVVLPAEGDRPDLPPLLLENLAMRFGIASPDASATELEAYLRDAAKDYSDMKARLDALAAADGRIANLMGAAKGAMDAGDFDEADARLADAEEIQQTEHTLVQVRKQAELRTERGKAALMKFDVDAAYGHFSEAAAFFEPFDQEEAFNARNGAGRWFFEHGQRFAGHAPQALARLQRLNIEQTPKEEFPELWARANNNLAIALQEQGTRAEGEAGLTLLADAVTAYRTALEVRTRDAMPVDWATTQNNLGNALQEQGIRAEGEAGLTLLSEAVTAFRAALEVQTREAMPVQWAVTNENVALAFEAMAAAEPDRAGEHLQSALIHVDRSLEVFDPEHMPFNFQKATRLREETQKKLAALEGE
ncbi:MAG: helix-turn-helix transcriptional regulator [Pseudomonadota bacterium]